MFKYIIFFAAILAACNSNKSESASGPGDSTNVDNSLMNRKAFTWTIDDENQFLSDCIDSSKARVGETEAFKRCKCVLQNLKRQFPNLDSASSALMDREQALKLVGDCQ